MILVSAGRSLRSMRGIALFSATTGNFLSGKRSGFAGQMTNGWALSGITTYQTGFPIRITSLADNELMYSFDFELPGRARSDRALPHA